MADTTFLKDNLAGTVPVQICKEIMENIIDQASILKVSKKIPMESDTMVVPRMTKSGTAAWVDEGEEIGVTLPTFEYPKLKVKKIGVIVQVTREKYNDSVINVFSEIKQAIADQFAAVIDNSCIFGIGSPFDTNLITAIGTQKITATSKLDTDLSDAMGLVEDNKYNCSNILMGTSQKKVLRALANDSKYKGAVTLSSAYDTPIEYVRNWDNTKATTIVGDFTRSIVGTRENMQYEILREATIKNGDETINLAQRDMLGVKCTMRMAYLVADPKAFSMVVSA